MKYFIYLLLMVFNNSCFSSAQITSTNIYCLNDQGNWKWLYQESNFDQIYSEGYELLPDKEIAIGTLYTKTIHDNTKTLKYFIVEKGISEIQYLNKLCKHEYGKDYLAYALNPQDYYSNYILVGNHAEAEQYYFNNYEKYKINIISFTYGSNYQYMIRF